MKWTWVIVAGLCTICFMIYSFMAYGY